MKISHHVCGVWTDRLPFILVTSLVGSCQHLSTSRQFTPYIWDAAHLIMPVMISNSDSSPCIFSVAAHRIVTAQLSIQSSPVIMNDKNPLSYYNPILLFSVLNSPISIIKYGQHIHVWRRVSQPQSSFGSPYLNALCGVNLKLCKGDWRPMTPYFLRCPVSSDHFLNLVQRKWPFLGG